MSKTTNVLYIITKGNLGGAQRYVYDLATNVPKSKYWVSVCMGEADKLKDKLEAKNIETRTIKGLKRDISLFDEVSVFFRIFSIIRDTEPDIVHLNSAKAGGIGSVAVVFFNCFKFLKFLVKKAAGKDAEFTKTKSIFTAHGWTFKEKRPVLQLFFIVLLSWITVLLCDRTIVVSQDDEDKILKFKLPFVSKKIILIYNGIRVKRLSGKARARDMLGIEKTSFVVGSVSELTTNKGLTYAIDGFKELLEDNEVRQTTKSAIHFVIIGEGEMRGELEKKVASYGLSHRVSFLGYTDDAFMLLKGFDVFLMSSLKEGLPYSLLEAGAAKLPIVATEVGGIGEIIEDRHSGFLIGPQKPGEIKEALKSLLLDSKRSKEFGKKVYETISENFLMGDMVDKTCEIYDGK
ncbi:MAG: hypothetical protein COV70_01390 [Parcubacteria group bacterium CG11_big_fil_rev_8_21_14_0_20_39_22]|nr:MAG: hypothetical protein COV70_01390 [Parcubacteria group bacterium CG11_big_fil_rev_8_21_14_0_20_39_22]